VNCKEGYVTRHLPPTALEKFSTVQEINGDPALVAIERAIHELRCGRVIGCCRSGPFETSEAGDVLVASAETASAVLIARLEELAGEHGLALAITRERAETLGIRAPDGGSHEGDALLLRLHRPVAPTMVSWLAGVDEDPSMSLSCGREFSVESADALAGAALKLAKRARLLPAVLVIPSASLAKDVLYVSTAQLEHLEYSGPLELERVSGARVPLAGHEDCRLVLFRDGRDSSEHVAVLIGSPQGAVVPVRLHSACLTGDLLASLRCDCGDQLRSGVDQLAAVGGGVLLYLAQEGRGIGLANKLRAYQLQDSGLDTIEADRHLGFRADERSYAAAASMLRHLGMTRIRLLTNNLDKIEALREEGIDVVGGQRLIGAVNRHNARYVHAKRERAGHLMPEIDMDGML
jgi:GTP cyclohydrolase II